MGSLNLVGERYARLLVKAKTSMRQDGSVVYKCLCDCGETCYVSSRNLRAKPPHNIKSCGCWRREQMREAQKMRWKN